MLRQETSQGKCLEGFLFMFFTLVATLTGKDTYAGTDLLFGKKVIFSMVYGMEMVHKGLRVPPLGTHLSFVYLSQRQPLFGFTRKPIILGLPITDGFDGRPHKRCVTKRLYTDEIFASYL